MSGWPVSRRAAAGAARALAGGADLGVAASHQQVEIPLVSARVIQHDRHAVRCGCGQVTCAPAPPGAGAPGTVTYGPNLQAWCVYLMVTHAIPVHRCAELIASLTGAPALGRVRARHARPRRRRGQAAANTLIRAAGHRRARGVLRRDPAPGRARGPGGASAGCWPPATPLLTYYALADRTTASFAAFVLPDLTGVVVHDRYHIYDHAQLGPLTHQLCCAPLLRYRGYADTGGGGAGGRGWAGPGYRHNQRASRKASSWSGGGSGRAGLPAGWSGRGLAA